MASPSPLVTPVIRTVFWSLAFFIAPDSKLSSRKRRIETGRSAPSARIQGRPNLPKNSRQSLRSKMRIQTARIGQHPNQRIANPFLLRTHFGGGALECHSISAHAQHCHRSRPISSHLFLEDLPTGNELLPAEFVRSQRSSLDQIG